jgi:hypothetical protein
MAIDPGAQGTRHELRSNDEMRARRYFTTGLIATAALAVAAASAHAGTFICVPATAGAAITSGGTSGTCSSGTSVQLPTSTEDQQKLIAILPYVTYTASNPNLGGKPSIVFSGVNLQVQKQISTDPNTNDGTGNLIVGRPGGAYSLFPRTGSENLVVGTTNGWTGTGNVVAGAFNNANGSYAAVFGAGNTSNAMYASSFGGHFTTASGQYSTIFGGRNLTATKDGQVLSQTNTHYVRTDSSGNTIGKSDPDAVLYNGAAYTYFTIPGVDPSKCSITVEATNVLFSDGPITTSYQLYGSYVYARAQQLHPNGSVDWYPKTGLDVTMECPS